MSSMLQKSPLSVNPQTVFVLDRSTREGPPIQGWALLPHRLWHPEQGHYTEVSGGPIVAISPRGTLTFIDYETRQLRRTSEEEFEGAEGVFIYPSPAEWRKAALAALENAEGEQ